MTLHKPNLFSYIVFILTIAFFASCNDDEVLPDQSQSINSDFSDIKIQFEEYKSSQESNFRRKNNEKKLKWKSAKKIKFKNVDVIEVPVEYEFDVATLEEDQSMDISSEPRWKWETPTKVLIFLNKDKSLKRVALMKLIPDSDYRELRKENIHNNSLVKIDSKYSGMVIFNFWDELLDIGFKLEDGKIVARTHTEVQARMISECVTYDVYLLKCVNNDCFIEYVGPETYCISYEDRGGGSSGWGGTTPPSSGGSTGGGSSSADTWEVKQIDANQLKPCIGNVLTGISNISDGVGQIVQDFSGSIPGYNWKLKDGTLTTEGQNAFTSQDYSKTTGIVTTTIDSYKFIDASNVSVARTLFHEAVHAYLVVFFRLDGLEARKTYPQLMVDYQSLTLGTPNAANIAHHNEMVRSFVKDIGLALKSYAKSQGIFSSSSTFWNDLAWGGLEETAAFKALPVADQKRIRDVILIEQFGRNQYGIKKPQVGKKAGC